MPLIAFLPRYLHIRRSGFCIRLAYAARTALTTIHEPLERAAHDLAAEAVSDRAMRWVHFNE